MKGTSLHLTARRHGSLELPKALGLFGAATLSGYVAWRLAGLTGLAVFAVVVVVSAFLVSVGLRFTTTRRES